MSTNHFTVEEHNIPAQHIRQYHNALKSHQEDVLHLAVKTYRPRHPSSPASSHPPITIIAGHANGIPKEAYEPVWDDLLLALRARSLDIRSIWIADNAQQGASGVLNEGKLGDDPSWFDHARDLLLMVNTFRADFPRPVIGVGHSMACAQLVHLATIHPRLLSGLVLCEPVILDAPPAGPNFALASTLRRDIWPSRAAAEAHVRAKRMFKNWDSRAQIAFLAHAFRATPTELHPEAGAVTLTTSKHQESWTFLRANFAALDNQERDRRLDPDFGASAGNDTLFFRPECALALRALPSLRPPVLWIFGERSIMSPPFLIAQKVATTGAGEGGSGGVHAGKVHHVVIPEGSHLVILEQIGEVVKVMAEWVGTCAVPEVKADEEFWKGYGSVSSMENMTRVSEAWVQAVKRHAGEKRKAKL